MGFAVVEVAVPVGDRCPVPDARGHLRLRTLFHARRLIFPFHAIGPDGGDESDPLSVREPLDGIRAGRDLREPPRFAAIDGDQVDLRFFVIPALGEERDAATVGTEGG